MKVKSVRGQVEYTALVVAGGQGILMLSKKDGRKLGIHMVGLLAGFLDERAAIVDDREWVEENTADMREEVRASMSELKEINKIVGPALDKNEKLPKSAVCNRPDTVYLFNIALDTKTWVWQYPVPAKAKQKVAERLKEWCENGWSKPAVPRNCNNNPLLAVDKKSAGVVAFDNIRLCINVRQLNTLNRTKKHTYMLPRIADILKKAFHISTDTSQHRVGAVLYQVVNREKKYVSFMSKVLKKGQRNYSATKRELLAIVYTLKRWEPFLAGMKFSVETDHKALSFLHNAKSHMVRDWARYLSTFDFTVSHIPGADNILPHYLSHLDGLIDKNTHDKELREAVITETAHTERAQIWFIALSLLFLFFHLFHNLSPALQLFIPLP